MTTFVLLLLILTSSLYVTMGAPAMQRSSQPAGGAAGDVPARRWGRTALGLAVVMMLTAHIAQSANLTQAALEACGQDEIAWAMRSQAQQPSTATAMADVAALREGE